MSKRGASLEIVDLHSRGFNAASDDLAASLEALTEAHNSYEYASELNTDPIADIDREIKALSEVRLRLMSERKIARSEAMEDRFNNTESLLAMLNDPNSVIHPIFRAVLLAPSKGSGSFENRNTFDGINQLGRDLEGLNDYLEQVDMPQPVVLVSDTFDYKRQKNQMQIDFGHTIAGIGLKPHEGQKVTSWHSSGVTEYGPQPMLILPIEESTKNAVSPSVYNSHYVYADGSVVGVDHLGRSRKKDITKEDFVPQVQELEIPLPAANLDARDTAKPFIYYDSASGDVEVIEVPKVLGAGAKVTCAIGEMATLHLLMDQNKIDMQMDAEQRRVMRNMSLSVARRGLGLAIKRSNFPRK